MDAATPAREPAVYCIDDGVIRYARTLSIFFSAPSLSTFSPGHAPEYIQTLLQEDYLVCGVVALMFSSSAQKRELALSSAFREKISGLEQDATKVERLLKSLQVGTHRSYCSDPIPTTAYPRERAKPLRFWAVLFSALATIRGTLRKTTYPFRLWIAPEKIAPNSRIIRLDVNVHENSRLVCGDMTFTSSDLRKSGARG